MEGKAKNMLQNNGHLEYNIGWGLRQEQGEEEESEEEEEEICWWLSGLDL